jgi:hypothetical protein
MKADLQPRQPRFSPRVFLVVSVLHALNSALLGGLAFTTGMGAFTKNVSSEMAFFQVVGWLWTAPQMIALQHPNGAFGLGGLFLITIVWSSMVGLAVGFIVPRFFHSRRASSTSAVGPGHHGF